MLIICIVIVGAIIVGVSVFFGVFYDPEGEHHDGKSMGIRGFLDSLTNDTYHTTDHYQH